MDPGTLEVDNRVKTMRREAPRVVVIKYNNQ